MGGIAICFPMADLLIGSIGNMNSIAKYMGRIQFSMKMSGRTAETDEGIARRVSKVLGTKKTITYVGLVIAYSTIAGLIFGLFF